MSKVISILLSRGGIHIQESQPDNVLPGSPTMNIMKLIQHRSDMRVVEAAMPVSGAWGLEEVLRGIIDNSNDCGGSGYSVSVHNTTMDGWRILPGDPTDTSSPAHAVVTSVRERKGLRIPLPTVDTFTDRL